MIKIIVPALNFREALAIRDRIRGLILQAGETAEVIVEGVVITTDNPVRVCLELQGEGFF